MNVEPSVIAPLVLRIWAVSALIGVGMSALIIWFLVKRKSAFVKPAQSV